jgi:hypothetical protein
MRNAILFALFVATIFIAPVMSTSSELTGSLACLPCERP